MSQRYRHAYCNFSTLAVGTVVTATGSTAVTTCAAAAASTPLQRQILKDNCRLCMIDSAGALAYTDASCKTQPKGLD
eukprot:366122-Chlamydomonas_euryale.AAC.21